MPPSVIWLTLDSIRADRTSVHGHDRRTTPQMERIASSADGVAFDDCISHGIWSQPSISSMLTGTHPSRHGAGLHNEVLPDEIETVPERLGDAGYRTACLSINPYCSEATGVDRGFDRFRSLATPRDFATADSVVPLLKFLRRIRTHSAGLTTDVPKHKQDYVVNEIAKQWVSSLADGDDPFFMYAHYQGAHYPYYPPEHWRRHFTDEIAMSDEEALSFVYERTSNIYRELANGCQYTDEQWEALRAIYDASVAYSDTLVGELYDHVLSLDLDDVVFVVTADHGDLLGEHDLISHNLLTHDALLNVPAVVHGMGDCADRSDEVVQHADLMRTILERAGARTDGMSAVDLRRESREYAVSQRGAETVERTFQRGREFNPEFTTHPAVHHSLVTALRTSDYKYQYSDDRTELFELPDETEDVSEDHPDLVDWFEERRHGEVAAESERVESGATADHSDAVKARLEQLGYVTD